jgi:hypothetical protein
VLCFRNTVGSEWCDSLCGWRSLWQHDSAIFGPHLAQCKYGYNRFHYSAVVFLFSAAAPVHVGDSEDPSVELLNNKIPTQFLLFTVSGKGIYRMNPMYRLSVFTKMRRLMTSILIILLQNIPSANFWSYFTGISALNMPQRFVLLRIFHFSITLFFVTRRGLFGAVVAQAVYVWL